MQHLHNSILTTLILLTSCATSSGALKMGPDTYTISVGASPARGGVIGAKKIAYEEATKECLKSNKEMLIKSEESETTNRVGAGNIDITFRCLNKDDPELANRPSYKSVPDVVIQDNRK